MNELEPGEYANIDSESRPNIQNEFTQLPIHEYAQPTAGSTKKNQQIKGDTEKPTDGLREKNRSKKKFCVKLNTRSMIFILLTISVFSICSSLAALSLSIINMKSMIIINFLVDSYTHICSY